MKFALLLLVEGQRVSIHAVAQPGGLGTIVEDVAEMGVAIGAAHLRARHEQRAILVLAHGTVVDRLIEARPAGAGLVFGVGIKQRLAAAYAAVEAVFLVVPVRPREGALRAMLARDLILFRRKLLSPLRVGFLDPGLGILAHASLQFCPPECSG